MKYLSAIILTAITVSLQSQSFEGTLTYIVDLEVSPQLIEMGIDKETLLNKMKAENSWSDTIRTTYKGGNYYTSYGETCLIYLSNTNKLYCMKLSGEGSDVCIVTDASGTEYLTFGEMLEIEKLDTQVVINDVNCNIVRIKWKQAGTYYYYYNSSMFSVNPSLFEKHICDGLAQFLEISKALPIQTVREITGMMKVTMTLISSKTENVDDNLFTIPRLVKDKKLNTMKILGKEIMKIKKNKK